MRKFVLLIFLILIVQLVKGQRIVNDTICTKDTVIVQGIWTFPKDTKLADPSGSFFALYCDYRKKIGFRFDFGFSQYLYENSVTDWLGFHQGTNLNFILVYDKFNIGFRFKPWTTNPKSEIQFDNKVLTKEADLNPLKFDYYIGYEIDLGNSISLEPSVGYTECKFKVINEVEINEKFSFNSTNGLLLGMTFNKYFVVFNYSYVALFCRINHGFVDFSEIHNDLQGNYTELCLGVSYKLYWKERRYNIIK